jgi:hypothetical protein
LSEKNFIFGDKIEVLKDFDADSIKIKKGINQFEWFWFCGIIFVPVIMIKQMLLFFK